MLKDNSNLTDAQRMSDLRHISGSYIEGVTELLTNKHIQSAEDMYFELRGIYSFDGIESLTDAELLRLYKYYALQMTYQEIADEEEVAYNAVRKSVTSAVEKLKKFLKEGDN